LISTRLSIFFKEKAAMIVNKIVVDETRKLKKIVKI